MAAFSRLMSNTEVNRFDESRGNIAIEMSNLAINRPNNRPV